MKDISQVMMIHEYQLNEEVSSVTALYAGYILHMHKVLDGLAQEGLPLYTGSSMLVDEATLLALRTPLPQYTFVPGWARIVEEGQST